MGRKAATKPKTRKKRAVKVPPGFELLHTLRGHKGIIWEIAWSPDGRTLASGSNDNTIRLWDTAGGDLRRTLEGHGGSVFSVSWSPDGGTIASGSHDDTILLWDAAGGELRRTLEGHEGFVYSVSWSPDGLTLASGSLDGTIRLWDAPSGKMRRTLKGHGSIANSVSWSPDGRMLASGSDDRTIHLWDAPSGKLLRTLEGHGHVVYSVSWSPDGRTLASGSGDNTIRVWDTSSQRELSVFEGHTQSVVAVRVSPDGRLLASKSDDGTVRLWRTDTGALLRILKESSTGAQWGGLAFHTSEPILATLGEEDAVIRIWRVDYEALFGAAPALPSVHYSNAKVVLVGDSGVGKTGLGLVLSGKKWKPTESTHKRNIWPLEEKVVPLGEGRKITRETLLWDLAGQPGYRIIHQLSLTEVAVALVVFDAHSETDPFAGVAHWNKALTQAVKVSRGSAPPLRKYLVGARIDRGGIGVTKKRLERVLQQYGFDGYFTTSAKEGTSVGDLLERIKAGIPWDALPSVSSTELFYGIKKFLLKVKEDGRLICTVDELYSNFKKGGEVPRANRDEDLEQEFKTCIGLVEGRGLIRRLNFGDLVLLQPELLDAYAACLINAAKEEPDGLGSIAESDARTGRFPIPRDEQVLDKEQEKLLLIAMVEDMLRHEIAMREEGDLVFPSQFRRENPDLPDPEGKEVVFRFEGAVMNIYATLVVRLAHSGMFTLTSEDMWRNAAILGSAAGGRFGMALSGGIEEGWGDLTLFYQDGAEGGLRLQFEDFVYAHLTKRAVPESVTSRRFLACLGCGTPVSDIVVTKARQLGKKQITCQICDRAISLVEERVAVGAEPEEAVADMGRAADAGRDKAAAVSVIEGKRATKDYDVFLCHNSKDKPAVKDIGKRLIKRGLLPWLDESELRPGEVWINALDEIIRQVDCAAVFVGPNDTGKFEKIEIRALVRQFVNGGVRVIPVLLPGSTKEPDWSLFLDDFHRVDFRKADPDPFEQLVFGITGKRGGPGRGKA